MINNPLSSYTASTSVKTDAQTLEKQIVPLAPPLSPSLPLLSSYRQTWLVFAAAVFLVSVPVFIEAPLV
ncbi:MAG: DUF3120 domain-containing protein, partial [Fischerella sp.]|nr:DUF3120 domain-containing protein [Fischerella sp.]